MKRLLTLSTFLLLGAFSLLNTGCEEQEAPATVPSVDLVQYLGLWYEIGSIPQIFQLGCECTTAEYVADGPNQIKVINRCRLGNSNLINDIEGNAVPVPGTGGAQLKVQFPGSPQADYWILALAPDYSYAVVGTPSRSSLWILSRTPVLDDAIYNSLLDQMEAQGFNVNLVNKTEQSNCNI